MKRTGVYSSIFAAGCLAALASAIPASAQSGQPRIQKDALQHSTWHTAPREFQIIDDRPIIKDFREAPQQSGTIDLPPGPQGFGGPGGGNGAGALGGGPGASIPGTGMAVPGNGPGYRNDLPNMTGMGGLPKSGFGRESNIPRHGGPGRNLPGVNQNVIGKLMNQPKATGNAGTPAGMRPTVAKTSGNSSVPVASYNGGYGNGSGSGYGGSSSQTATSVRGSLLKK